MCISAFMGNHTSRHVACVAGDNSVNMIVYVEPVSSVMVQAFAVIKDSGSNVYSAEGPKYVLTIISAARVAATGVKR